MSCQKNFAGLLQTSLGKGASTKSRRTFQRLEFLGDRVLSLVIADALFARFPEENEGALSQRLAALVSGTTLAGVFSRMENRENQAEEEQASWKPEDQVEAQIGALYLDSGLDAARAWIMRLWEPLFAEQTTPPQDSKSALQEWAQARKYGLPCYQLVKKQGQDHAPLFTVQVSVGNFSPAVGVGTSCRMAEMDAATQLLSRLEDA